jgi:hypothetical protein
MDNWNHGEVVALANQWQEAGLSDTTSGRFLRSLADTATPPRGRGVDWLVGLIKQGDPRPNVLLGKEIEKLVPLAGGNSASLSRIASDLKNGRAMPSWGYDFLARVKQGIISGDLPRDLTESERDLMSSLSIYKSGQSHVYWSRRPGTSNKLDKIFQMAARGEKLSNADVTYVKECFKKVVRQIENPDYPPGSIAQVNPRWVIFDNMHKAGTDDVNVTCMIIGSPRVSAAMRDVSVRVLVDGQVGDCCVRNLTRIS